MSSPRSRLLAAAILVGLAFASPGRLLAQYRTDEGEPLDPVDFSLIAEWPPADPNKLKLEPSERDKLLEAVRCSDIDPVVREDLLDALRRGEIVPERRPQVAAPPVAPARSSMGLLLVGIGVGVVLGALFTLVALRRTRKS